LVVQLTTRSLQALLDRLREDHEVPEEAAQGALRARTSFSAISPAGARVDFIFQKPRLFSREEFARRQRTQVLDVEAWVASVEDTILGKLEQGKESDAGLHLADVRSIVEARRYELDILHIERWVTELGLVELWEQAHRGSVT
jgi:hypothetical protein